MIAKGKAGIVEKSDDVAARLLGWYDMHARTLPWRRMPGETRANFNDFRPYHVWLSEIMLQQTTVAAVKPYFAKFTRRWKDVEALAAADDADVMAAWAGLGYYARARNLLKCARVVAKEHGGKFPDTEAELLKLPGIGPYTAAAIAAIAFGQRAVVVDANVERVVARLFAISQPLPGARTEIRQCTNSITPDVRTGDFAQAMMDLGAGVCSVREPACTLCPIRENCAAFAKGTPTVFPVKPPKKTKPVRRGAVFWIEHKNKIWLIRRSDTGMLAGMRALPSDNWSARRSGNGDMSNGFLPDGPWEKRPDAVAHVFTHFALTLDLVVYRGKDFDMPLNAGEWWPLGEIADAGLPTLFTKAVTAYEKIQKRTHDNAQTGE
ncbi:A/G-specific adenine glycosylase [Sphingorhabdus sp. Alg239-R122]|uniref:A/G-specific adenine glycosylase n=1 Tax=Sphingorhabdus sp. Alg239-R122 TaxID=2305989 RepID=UPI0013DCCB24|nr:A/G-specific adenine glycosylase [Sphingorhabdus sp. Alg239-R122]